MSAKEEAGPEISSTEDLVNPWRLAKGDLMVAYNLRGKVCRAVPGWLTITQDLIIKEVFPKHYEIYGVGFLELRNAFRSGLSVRSSAVLLEQWGAGMSGGTAGEIYQNVCRVLGNKRITMTEYVLEQPKEKLVLAEVGLYRTCFDLLIEVMDRERERVRKDKKD